MAQDINVNITNGVTEVNGVVPDINGVITIETGDIPESVNANFVSDAQLTVIGNTSGTNTGDQDLSGLVVKNANITGATKTKITYDAKGLVTSGADATTADVADSTNKRYVTDANLTVIGNTSGTNTGDETLSTIKTKLGITTLSGSNTGDQDLIGYQLISEKDTINGYLGITANLVTLPNGRGFQSLNVTPNQIAYFDSSGNLLTLSTSTYPSIAQLAYVKGVTSAIQTQLDAKSAKLITENAQTGTSYTLVLTDADKLLSTSNTAANTVTIPPNASVAFSVGTQIVGIQLGAGQTSLVAGTGVTILSSGAKLKCTGQYSGYTLIKQATNVWLLMGDIAL